MRDIDDEMMRQYACPTTDNQSASVVQIESSKMMPLLVILAILCGASMGLTAFAFSAARDAETETRMLEYYLLELDAKFIKAGLKDPAESISKRLQLEEERRK